MICKNKKLPKIVSPIKIYRGDDSDAFNLGNITIRISGELPLDNAIAKFSLLGFSKEWTNEETKTGEFVLTIPSDVSRNLPLGECFGKIELFDISGGSDQRKRLTVVNTIPFFVSNKVFGVPHQEYDAFIEIVDGTTIDIVFETGGSVVILDDYVTEESQNGVKSSGIWTWAKSLLPSWLTPEYAEPATVESVAAKYTKPSDGIPLSDLKPTTFPPSVHASSHSTGSSDAIAPADIGAQEALPTTGTARVTYAVNISGNAATATSIAEGSISKLWNGKSFANKYFVDVDGHIYSANNTGGCYFQSPSGMKYYLSSTSSYDSGGERVYEYSFTSESNPSLVMKYSSSTKRITQQWGSYRYGTIDDFNPFLSESIAGIEFTGGGLTDYFSFTAASWQVSNSFVKTGAALYSGTTSYTANQWVVYDNKLWVSKQSTRGNAPYAGSAYWVDMSSLSALFSTANSANNLDNIRTSTADDTTAKNYIDGKLDKSGDTMTGNLEVTNTDGYPKVLVGDNNGDYAEYQKDGIFTNNGWLGFGAKNGTVAVEDDLNNKLDASSTQSFNDSQKSKLSTNGGYRYKLVNATLTRDSSHTIPASGGGTQTIDCDYCSVSDYTITTIDCSAMLTNKLVVHLPTALDNRSRDLLLKIKVSSSTPPTFYVVGTGAETISFASDNEDWATLESGENVILLTETERSN